MRKNEKIFHQIMRTLHNNYKGKFVCWCDGKYHNFHIYRDKHQPVFPDEKLKEILETYNLPYEEKNYTYVIKKELYSKLSTETLQQIIVLLKLNGIKYND